MSAMSLRRKATKHNRTKVKIAHKRLIRPLVFSALFGVVGSILLYISFADVTTPTSRPPVAHNPVVAENCNGGLDVALVADVSGSITQNPAYVADIKSAYTDFVNALLPSTKSEFSLTEFDDTATVVVPFTNNINSLHNGINNLGGGSSTNWLDGLTTGYSTLTGFADSSRPKLLIIATDGDPNQPGGGGGGGGYGGGGGGATTTALWDAMVEANIIKEHNIHILAVGIGSDPTVANLEAITGTNLNTGGIDADVETSAYSTFAATMTSIANTSCGSGSVGTGGNGAGSGGSGLGVGGTGTGTGGSGLGSGGTGTGTSGSGLGSGGSGKGTSGSGLGSGGSGTSSSKASTGTSTSKTTPKGTSSNPSKTQGTSQTPTTTPKITTSPNPAPTPVATTISPQPNPVPTPTAQGTQTEPPVVQPSPFYDGKEYTRDSAPDSLASVTVHHSNGTWWYILSGMIIVGVAGFIYWRRRVEKTLKPKAVHRKRSKKKSSK